MKETYVWEDLSAHRFEDGANPKFKRTTKILCEYAIAGVLHLDHLADLQYSGQNKPAIDRNIFQLSRCLGNPEIEIQSKLARLLRQHEREWTMFVHSLGPDSFVAKWATRGS